MKINNAILLVALGLTGCGEEPQPAKLPASEDVLAQYQTIHIGQERLSLPTIALLSSTTNSNLTLSDGTEVPVRNVLSQSTHGSRVSQVRLALDAYGQLYDFNLDTHAYVSKAFCERLLMDWERNQCKTGLYDGKTVFLPRHISLVERSFLLGSTEQLFALAGKGPSAGESARRMLAQTPEPQFTCVPTQQPLCTAIIPIRGDLVAVWTTGRKSVEEEREKVRWLLKKYLK